MQFSVLFLLGAFLTFTSNTLIAQKIAAYDTFHGTKSKATINVEDDLYLRFSLAKSLTSLNQAKGFSSDKAVYGALRMQFSNLIMTTETFKLAEGKETELKEFDLIFSVVMKQFHALVHENKTDWGTKDELMLKVMASPQNPMTTWMQLIAGGALEGQTEVAKIELFLCEETATSESIRAFTEDMAIAKGTFNVKVAAKSLDPLYGTRIPALYRPAPDFGISHDIHQKNIGKILWANQPIHAEEETASFFDKKFSTSKSAVHGRIYFPKSIRNIGAGFGQDKTCAYQLEYFINDTLIYSELKTTAHQVCQLETSLPLVIWTNPDKEAEDYTPTAFEKKFAALQQDLEFGDHIFKVKVSFMVKRGDREEGVEIASSTFILSID